MKLILFSIFVILVYIAMGDVPTKFMMVLLWLACFVDIIDGYVTRFGKITVRYEIKTKDNDKD